MQSGKPEDDRHEVVWSDKSPLSELLGFDLSAEAGEDRSGLKALINSALVSHRRLPMLDVVFDRASRLMSTSLRLLTNENVEAALDNVTSVRFADFIESQPPSAVIGVIRSKLLDGYALLAVDPPLAHCVVDLLLGGRRGAFGGLEGRALTTIELGLAGRMLSLLVEDFDEAFRPVEDAGFSLDRIETTPRFAAIAQEASVCALAKFRVRIDDFSSKATILVPHATIEPVRDLLLRDFIGEAGAADALWKRRLGAGVTSAAVDLKAALADRTMTIRDLMNLKAGDLIAFASGLEARVELRAGDSVVAKGRVGRLGEIIAVRLEAALGGDCADIMEKAA